MPTKYTKEKILAELAVLYNNKYTYPNFNENTLQNKIEIICPIHGSFKKYTYCHLSRKQGCPKCSHIGLSKYSEAQFLESIYKVHGKDITFEILTPYKGNTESILIRDKYGICEVKAYALTRSNVSSLRTAIDKTSYIIAKFNEKHNHRYDYSKFIYKGNRVKSTITCKIHGDFEQSTDVHLMGSGCTECGQLSKKAGFGRTDFINICQNDATLYLIECFNEQERFLKIGITSKSVKQRYGSNHEMPYSYKILREIKGLPEDIWNLELRVKQSFSAKQYKPYTYFKGITECFGLDSKKDILEYFKINLQDI